MDRPTLHTRREFLRTTLLGGALGWTLPSFLDMTIAEMARAADGSLLQIETGKDSPILVVIQLGGGNDGLNTVVPFGDDEYLRARPTLGLRKQQCIPLTDSQGLHPNLGDLKALLDEGRLAILQGVGYPNPNRSHFRSMEIWETASDAHRTEPTGWVGRYFDNHCAGADASVGVVMADQLPQAFASKRPRGITLGPNAMRSGGVNDVMGGFGDTSAANAGDSIGELSGSRRAHVSPLDYLEKVALDAQVAAEQVDRILGRPFGQPTYPVTPLARKLSVIARLIAGGMSTRVYYASLGGFDTHANQAATHANLLAQFGGALRAFVQDLEAQGNLERVAVLCFSEFGRRVRENASGGTDHGAAAPLFIAGGGLRAGLHGTPPSLAADDLVRGDIPHQIDFRSVYATLLERHLKADSLPVLGRRFARLDLRPVA